MRFYKISSISSEKSIVFRCVENYNSNSIALDYTAKNDILPESFATKSLTISQVDEAEYKDYLLGKMYDVFYQELERIKESWKNKTPDEICSVCYKAVYIGDRMKAINIRWDTDGENISLPKEIDIPEGMTDEDEISDYISDVTGFCHKGFELIHS